MTIQDNTGIRIFREKKIIRKKEKKVVPMNGLLEPIPSQKKRTSSIFQDCIDHNLLYLTRDLLYWPCKCDFFFERFVI